jgi:hypothetical protein
MNYQQLQEYALQCSLEHHLCNVEDFLDEGQTPSDILALLEAGSNEPVIWEQYEYSPREDVVEMVEDARGVHLHNFMHILTEVNGEEWFANFKAGK